MLQHPVLAGKISLSYQVWSGRGRYQQRSWTWGYSDCPEESEMP